MIQLEVSLQDQVTPRIDALNNALTARRSSLSDAGKKIAAAAGANVVKAHFADLERSRHRGTSPFHFYGKATRATSHRVQNGTAVVAIDHEGIQLRRFGGTVKPRNGKYLTLPVDPVAHGRRIREFSGEKLNWIINKQRGTGVVLLAGKVLYALTQKTEHKPDPSVLPTDSQILDQVTDDLHVWTNSQ